MKVSCLIIWLIQVCTLVIVETMFLGVNFKYREDIRDQKGIHEINPNLEVDEGHQDEAGVMSEHLNIFHDHFKF